MAAAVELALGRRVLGDVGEPQLRREPRARSRGSPGRRGRLVRGPCRWCAGPSWWWSTRSGALGTAGGPGPSPTSWPGRFELVGDEAVAELGVVAVDVDDGVDQMGVVPVPGTDRVGRPLVEGLGGEAQHPAGQPSRGTPRRPALGPAGTSFWERAPWRSRRRPDAGSRSPARAGGLSRRSWTISACSADVSPSLMPSSMSAWCIQRLTDSTETSKSAATSAKLGSPSVAGHRDDITLELVGELPGHGSILSARTILAIRDVNQTRGSPGGVTWPQRPSPPRIRTRSPQSNA